jgi:hypothetical protein
MPVQTEGNYLNDLLKWELENLQSRETVTVLSGQNLAMGDVIGKITKSTPTTGTKTAGATGGGTMTSVTAGVKAEIGTYSIACAAIDTQTPATPATAAAFTHNTGNGTMSAVVVGATAKVGVYLLEVLKTGATGAFVVRYPDGSLVGQGVIGTEFVGGGLTFTLADGGTDYIVGDGYTITVAAASTGAGAKWDITTPSSVKLATQALTGSAYTSDHLNFTINDSGTNFAVGDTFTVAVAAGAGQVRELNLTGVDGSQDAYGVLIQGVDTADTTQRFIAYTSGGTAELEPGDVVTGATSGATAQVVSLTLTSGTWAGGDAAGVLIVDNQVGTFESENLNATNQDNICTIGANTAVYNPDLPAVAIVRDAQIVDDYLGWPTGATAGQKAAALAHLYDKGIVNRDDA